MSATLSRGGRMLATGVREQVAGLAFQHATEGVPRLVLETRRGLVAHELVRRRVRDSQRFGEGVGRHAPLLEQSLQMPVGCHVRKIDLVSPLDNSVLWRYYTVTPKRSYPMRLSLLFSVLLIVAGLVGFVVAAKVADDLLSFPVIVLSVVAVVTGFARGADRLSRDVA